MTNLRATFHRTVPLLGIVVSSSIAVSSLGVLSVFGAFAAALFLGVWRAHMPVRPIATLITVVSVYAAAWLSSSWWLAVGVHSMNQSYWWTGYCAALVAALWGGAPYAVLSLRIHFSNPILRSAFWSALLSVAVHMWPHPFNCTAAIGLVSALPLLQAAELGGLPLVFFLLYFLSFLFVELWSTQNSVTMRRGILMVVLTIVFAWSGYGMYSIDLFTDQAPADRTIQVGVIQPNIPIEGVPPLGNPGSRGELFTTSKNMGSGVQKVDLVVWPEIPIYFSPINNPVDKQEVFNLVQSIGVPLLLNADMYTNETVHGRVPFYNTEQLYRPNVEKPEEYRKNLLIPIGEYLPFESLISSPETERILSGLRRYIPGDSVTTFVIPTAEGRTVAVGTPICLELLNSNLVHRMVATGADAIISPANDAYFRNKAAARLALAFGAVRAVENRVPVVRVTNSGMSGWIDRSGQISERELLPHFQPASSIFQVPIFEQEQSRFAKELQGIIGLTTLLVLLLCIRIYPSRA
jgi:apolipoprotein N-acyltransferase